MGSSQQHVRLPLFPTGFSNALLSNERPAKSSTSPQAVSVNTVEGSSTRIKVEPEMRSTSTTAIPDENWKHTSFRIPKQKSGASANSQWMSKSDRPPALSNHFLKKRQPLHHSQKYSKQSDLVDQHRL